jgi:hypothetical protein
MVSENGWYRAHRGHDEVDSFLPKDMRPYEGGFMKLVTKRVVKVWGTGSR